MSQVFKPGANVIARASILVGLMFVAMSLGMLLLRNFSPFTVNGNYSGVVVAQPIRFSHELHSGQLNIGCMYCHASAEVSPYAGIPDVATCMTCHSQLAIYSELLEPVRESYATGEPIQWLGVHDLAEHVYFNHSIHVNNGFACQTCHGNVDEMPQVWQAENMYMGWCLDCHFAPEQYIRPLADRYVFYDVPEAEMLPLEEREALVEEYGIDTDGGNPAINRLGNCSTCHR